MTRVPRRVASYSVNLYGFLEPREPGCPEWPEGPHSALQRTLALAGVSADAQIQMMEAAGMQPWELGGLITLAAPHLITGSSHRPPLDRLGALEDWTRQHLAHPEAVIPHLLDGRALPPSVQASDPRVAKRLGLLPAWLLDIPRSGFCFEFSKVPPPSFEALETWLDRAEVDVHFEDLELPTRWDRKNRLRSQLRLQGVSGLRDCYVPGFLDRPSRLEVRDCPDLVCLRGFARATEVHIANCPSLKVVRLSGRGLVTLTLENCPTLEVLEIFGTRNQRPEVRLQGCPALGDLKLKALASIHREDISAAPAGGTPCLQ